uniref:Fibronectin type-III domain-containing protein n=1 Tax=Steinernema glaseri TaxID=37863 RepID=A0A1I7YE17_9BILA
MRTIKVDKSLQDMFRVEYNQVSPYRKFPILDVNDIMEQKYVELYLGNLSPGRDYEVTVTSIREDLPSRPWKGLITTKPLKPVNLTVSEINATCVKLSWNLPFDSGADRFKIAYGEMQGDPPTTKLETPYSQESAELCEQIIPGQSYLFAVIAEKSHQISDAATTSHTVKPLPPIEVHVTPDFEKGKYKVAVDLPHRKYSKIDKCTITVTSEQLQRSEKTVKANVDEERDVASFDMYRRC